jgi:hypothetical protein
MSMLPNKSARFFYFYFYGYWQPVAVLGA